MNQRVLLHGIVSEALNDSRMLRLTFQFLRQFHEVGCLHASRLLQDSLDRLLYLYILVIKVNEDVLDGVFIQARAPWI